MIVSIYSSENSAASAAVNIGVSCLGRPTKTLTLNMSPQNMAVIYIHGFTRCHVVMTGSEREISFSGSFSISSLEKFSK